MTRRAVAGLSLAVAMVAAGCTATSAGPASPADSSAGEALPAPVSPDVAPPVTPSPSPGTAPASTPTPSPKPQPAANPVSLPALMERDFDGRALRVGDVLASNEAYTKSAVTYRSGDLRISGVLYVPTGAGPFPALVLNHGYIDPDIYVTGQGLQIEQDYLARSGFVVLHTDYRNHAGSDSDPTNDKRFRLGYTDDTINAVLALRGSDLPVDPDRIGMMGRSMGGGVTMNALVVAPGLVDAAVIYASVSSSTVDNHNKWTVGERPELAGRIERRYGSPDQAPQFWAAVSPRTYFDRITEPVLVHHGTADDTCPIGWADETVAAMERQGVDVTYERYPGEGHAFSAAWADSMATTVEFFRRHL